MNKVFIISNELPKFAMNIGKMIVLKFSVFCNGYNSRRCKAGNQWGQVFVSGRLQYGNGWIKLSILHFAFSENIY